MRYEIPDLQTKVEQLQIQLQAEKRKTWAFDAYKAVDNPEAPVSIFLKIITLIFLNFQDQLGYKFFVQKLSGFAKFELDTKITKLQFFHLIEEICMKEVPDDNAQQEAPAEVNTPADGEGEAAETAPKTKK